jgi:hypothetical protein
MLPGPDLSFLSAVDPDLISAFENARNFVDSNPRRSMGDARNCLELLLHYLALRHRVSTSSSDSSFAQFVDRLRNIDRCLPARQASLALYIWREAAQGGSHSVVGGEIVRATPERAAQVFSALNEFAVWFVSDGKSGCAFGSLKTTALGVLALFALLWLVLRTCTHGHSVQPTYPIQNFPSPLNERVMTSTLNSRQGPGSEYRVTAQAHNGDPLIGIGTAQSKDGGVWQYVRSPSGASGFANSKLIGPAVVAQAAAPVIYASPGVRVPQAQQPTEPPTTAPVQVSVSDQDCGVGDGTFVRHCHLGTSNWSNRFIIPSGTRLCALANGVNAMDKGWVRTNAAFGNGSVLELMSARNEGIDVTLFVVPLGSECSLSLKPSSDD